MPGFGVLVNAGAVLVGTIVGLLAGNAIPERMRQTAMQTLGLAVLVVGLSGSIKALDVLAQVKGVGGYSMLIFVGSLVVGTVVGEALRLEDRLESFGNFLRKLVLRIPVLKKADSGVAASGSAQAEDDDSATFRVVEAFMTASLIFCVGAMTVLGSLEDGLGMPQTLYVKALLDGCTSIFLASSLGFGVGLSVIPILLFQGLIALVAALAGNIIPALAITGIEAVGGALIAVVGLNLLLNKKIAVGNMLPAVFIALGALWILA
jgi:uncharacterized membrane protein YqgA involved in biofilm formation